MHPFVAEMLGRPLGMDAQMLPVLAQARPMETRLARITASHMTDDEVGQVYLREKGSLAIVEVRGVMCRGGGWMSWLLGMTDTVALAGLLFDKAADTSVQTVVIDFHTPGGDTYGLDAVLAAIDACVEAGKRVVGVNTGGCFSAGLWAMSRCPERIFAPTSGGGSIGAMVVLEDSSRFYEEELKIRKIVVASTEIKGLSVPGVEITDAQLANEQHVIGRIHDAFVADVARGCGVSVETVEGWANGPNWFGREALDAGFATGVGVLEHVLSGALGEAGIT